jgi:PTH2 family peptidyl-tRNA hydrolase
MRKGKIAAQVAHASMKVIIDLMEIGPETIPGPDWEIYTQHSLCLGKFSPLNKWLFEGNFTKIVVGVESEDELLLIYARAQNEHMPCSLILDNGKTEFKGVKTYTCCAIGPDWPDVVDQLTGHLKLL